MKRVNASVAVLLGMFLFIAGCSQEQPKSQGKDQVTIQPGNQINEQVKNDLPKYVSAVKQAMSPWSKITTLTEELKKAKSAKVYVSKLRTEFVPIVTGVATQMDAIKPETKEVQEIHSAFTASIKDYLAGLKSMADAVETKDDKLTSEAAVKLNAFAQAQAKFIADTNALANKNNVKPL